MHKHMNIKDNSICIRIRDDTLCFHCSIKFKLITKTEMLKIFKNLFSEKNTIIQYRQENAKFLILLTFYFLKATFNTIILIFLVQIRNYQ